MLREQLYEKDLTIEGEFLSEAAMEEEGISESSVSIFSTADVVAYMPCFSRHLCGQSVVLSFPRQRREAIKKHCRTNPRQMMRTALPCVCVCACVCVCVCVCVHFSCCGQLWLHR